jgi:phosphatidylserine decarboxylase
MKKISKYLESCIKFLLRSARNAIRKIAGLPVGKIKINTSSESSIKEGLQKAGYTFGSK